MNTDRSLEQLSYDTVAGRSLDEQIEWVKKYGNHGVAPVLRARMLQSLGIPEPTQTAENLIIFGCYPPFAYGALLRDYISILDTLGLEYTYLLEKEFCCGMPLVADTTGPERKRAIKASRESVQRNINMAQQKGATNIAYCCVGCAHIVKGLLPDQAEHRMYLLDLIIDKLETKALRLAAPKVVGYFEGCHSTYHAIAPGVNLWWERYRRLLSKIENLRIVDLPHDVCCRKKPEATVKAAEKRNLDTILCACNSCYGRISVAARGRLQVKHFVEIALQSLKEFRPSGKGE